MYNWHVKSCTESFWRQHRGMIPDRGQRDVQRKHHRRKVMESQAQDDLLLQSKWHLRVLASSNDHVPCAASLVNCKAGSKLQDGNLNRYLNVNVHSKHNSTLDKRDSQQDKHVSTSCRVRGYLEEGRLCRQKTKQNKKWCYHCVFGKQGKSTF